jgi:hypothetical protein
MNIMALGMVLEGSFGNRNSAMMVPMHLERIQKNIFLTMNVQNMLCWRDLTKKCVEEDCPMWMTNFELSDVVDPEEIGLNENKCALVFNEKLGVMKTMVGILNSMSSMPSFIPPDLWAGKETGKREAAGSGARVARNVTRGGKTQKTLPVTEKRVPRGK